jgi:hypothetical protein
LRTGVPLEGLKTGSIEADLIAMFEGAALPIYFFLCLGLFLFWDALSLVRGPQNVQISVLAMLQVYRLFTYGATNESLVQALALFIRGFWQNLVFYLVVFSVTKIVFPSAFVLRRATNTASVLEQENYVCG